MPTEQHSPFYYMLQSRKFWATGVGLILIIVTAIINRQSIDPDTLVNGIMALVGIYVGSIAVEDGMTNRNAKTTTITTPSQNVDVSTSGAVVPTVTHTGLQ